MKKQIFFPLALLLCLQSFAVPTRYDVIAYYTGSAENLKKYPLSKLTHVIYSFAHLHGTELKFGNDGKKQQLIDIVALKKTFPGLKVMVAMGGWEGCKPCSEGFNSPEKRAAFAVSARKLMEETGADGLDLDWEYPGIPGPPGHPWMPEDKVNFTDLIIQLRQQFGNRYELSFAAGGFEKFLEASVEWDKVMPLVNRVNLMTYDLISGYSKVTGHHTTLYSRPSQKESTDHCVQWLIKNGIDPKKLVIGAAFYARVWEQVPDKNKGLDQPGKFKTSIPYSAQAAAFADTAGFRKYWDKKARAAYYFNAGKGLFATGDDPRSIKKKVGYMKKQRLGGIMFWELGEDAAENGLLSAIDAAIH